MKFCPFCLNSLQLDWKTDQFSSKLRILTCPTCPYNFPIQKGNPIERIRFFKPKKAVQIESVVDTREEVNGNFISKIS